jgi:hypothetical protein
MGVGLNRLLRRKARSLWSALPGRRPPVRFKAKMLLWLRRGAGWPSVAPHTTAEVLLRADLFSGGGGGGNRAQNER